MKKIMLFAVAACLSGAVFAGEYFQIGTVRSDAGVTNAVGYVRFDTRQGSAYGNIERIVFVNGSDTNAVATFYVAELGVETQIGQTATLAKGGSEILWPEKAVSRQSVSGTTTNTFSEYRLWPASSVKVKIRQTGQTATESVYTWGVYAR